MDVLELLKSRRSVRVYREDAVPRETLLQILDTARYAPTGANLQPWEFILVTDKDLRQKVGNHAKFFFIKSGHVSSAPALVVILGRTGKSEFCLVDCVLAGANIVTAAHALGLGSCWIGAFDAEKIKHVLGIPAELTVVGMITLGFIGQEPEPSPKLALEEVMHFDGYSGIKPSFARLTRQGPLSIWKKILRVMLGKG